MSDLGSTFVNEELDLSGRLGGMATRAPVVYDDFDAVDGTLILGNGTPPTNRSAPTSQVWQGFGPGAAACQITNGRMFTNAGNAYMFLPSASPRNEFRQNSDFPKRINAESTVQSGSQKYFVSPVGQIIFMNSPRPAPHKRGARDRHGRWARDAMDAAVSKANDADPPSLKLRRHRYQDRHAAFAETVADGEVVWA